MRLTLSPEKCMAIAIWKLATPDSYRSIGQQFGVGTSTVGAVVLQVMRAINHMLVWWLVSIRDLDAVVEGFTTLWFPQCFRAIEGMHSPIRAPDHSGSRYVNHKGYDSIMLQAMVDARGKFMDVYVSWLGRAHDTQILRNSTLFCRMEARTFVSRWKHATGKVMMSFCVMGDPAYPLQPWLMRPYMGHLTPSQELFNAQLTRARYPVECAFGHLKVRFRCLLTRLDVGVENVPQVVATC